MRGAESQRRTRAGRAVAALALIGTARCASTPGTSTPIADPTSGELSPGSPAVPTNDQVAEQLTGIEATRLVIAENLAAVETARRHWLDLPVRGASEGDVCSGYTPYRTCPEGMVCVVLGARTQYGECQRGVADPDHAPTCSDGSPARTVAVDESDESSARARLRDDWICTAPLTEGLHVVTTSQQAYAAHPERYETQSLEGTTVARYVPKRSEWALHNEVVLVEPRVRCDAVASPTSDADAGAPKAGDRCDPECGRPCGAGLVCVKQAFELHGNEIAWRADCQPEGRACSTDACGAGEACFNPEFLAGQRVTTVGEAITGRCQRFDLVER